MGTEVKAEPIGQSMEHGGMERFEERQEKSNPQKSRWSSLTIITHSHSSAEWRCVLKYLSVQFSIK